MFCTILLLAGAVSVAATPVPQDVLGLFENVRTHESAGGKAICHSGMIPVTATAKNMKLKLDANNQTEVSQTVQDWISTGSMLTSQIAGPLHTFTGTYNISATLCSPRSGMNLSSIQFLTHGIGFDKAYWDFAPGYSYVDAAAAAGRATFLYSRLGTGTSAYPDALQVVQAPLQVAMAIEMIKQLRARGFKNVVGVGHSFGSGLTTGIAAESPASLDAVVLTGFSTNSSGLPLFNSALNLAIASENQPHRFADKGPGYLVASSIISNGFCFLKAPNFAQSILRKAEATKGPVTFGDFFTQPLVIKPADKFTGPIDVVNGANDLAFCSGNCTVPVNQAAQVQPKLFPHASKSAHFLVPGTGHGINLHYTANMAYEHIQDFIKNAGF